MVEVTIVDEVWVVQGNSASRLFMQWDAAVPVIREMLLRGERVAVELAPVIGVQHDQATDVHD